MHEYQTDIRMVRVSRDCQKLSTRCDFFMRWQAVVDNLMSSLSSWEFRAPLSPHRPLLLTRRCRMPQGVGRIAVSPPSRLLPRHDERIYEVKWADGYHHGTCFTWTTAIRRQRHLGKREAGDAEDEEEEGC
jgi:hypothetical protein